MQYFVERGICYLLNRQDFKNGVKIYITYQREFMVSETKWALTANHMLLLTSCNNNLWIDMSFSAENIYYSETLCNIWQETKIHS
jgi:hypothetical protein